MARDSNGNYSSPSADFVTGLTISSSVTNAKLSDIGSEMTDSLSRSGKGGMLARWRGVDGTSSLPAYAFTSETTLGMYRAGTADLRFANNGTDLFKMTATENRSLQALKVTTGGLTVDAGGLTVTAGGSTITAGGLTVAAGGSAVTGSLPSQGGVAGASAFSTSGAISTTSGHSHALTGLTNFPAGATANPVRLNVRSQNVATVDEWQDVRVGLSYDVDTTPGLGGSAYLSPREGLRVTSGTTATGADPANALELTNGNLKLSGTAPNKDEALTNTLTPANIVKAWAIVALNNSASPTITDGLNVTSAAVVGGDLEVTLAGAFANTTYAAVPATGTTTLTVHPTTKTTTKTTFTGGNPIANTADVDLSTRTETVEIIWVGR